MTWRGRSDSYYEPEDSAHCPSCHHCDEPETCSACDRAFHFDKVMMLPEGDCEGVIFEPCEDEENHMLCATHS